MALTLNGIAQGYITDRVCDLLRREGVGHTMVDMGELRALDVRPDGSLWRVGLENGKREIKHIVELASRSRHLRRRGNNVRHLGKIRPSFRSAHRRRAPDMVQRLRDCSDRD
ncbi:hypothetical protein LMG27198_17490 [Methylocystis echinoides]|uniref:FAD:protein FMN transferase n=1 Tax=Methylocystis echinoides TaxID=29468 RepID=A0A9W6GTE7_9HYPH|nr:FAD:protein FMN transferase [Methylocystis echinoides]GLI92757.1 hypothetical protein LMG27198_17490 [Methylocystis echinoides]